MFLSSRLLEQTDRSSFHYRGMFYGSFILFSGTNVHEKSRSDVCRLRFKTHGYSQLILIGRDIPIPGISIYNSGEK